MTTQAPVHTNARSTCPPGQERYDEFYSRGINIILVQYDYRTHDGKLFTTVAPTLEIARARRDAWLEKEPK